MHKLKRIFLAVLEELAEVVVTFIFLGVGLLLLKAFGVNIDADTFDWEVAVLVGSGIILGTFILVCVLAHFIKKRVKNKSDRDSCKNGQEDVQ